MKARGTSGAPGAEVAERAAAAAERDAAADGQGTDCYGLPAGAGLPDALGDALESRNPPPAQFGHGASQTPRAVAPSALPFVDTLSPVEVALADVREAHVRCDPRTCQVKPQK